MKIEKFLKWIQDKLLNYPDINHHTTKMFMDKFFNFLSTNEKERYSLQFQMIREYTLKQISLDSIVNNERIKNLELEFDRLTKDDNIE